jgi:hypothetical protein
MGCGGLILVAVVVVGIAAFSTIKFAKNVEKEMQDPELRTTNGLASLNASSLPEGYHVTMNMRLPLNVARMVILADGEPESGPGVSSDGKHIFFYVEGPGWDSDWRKFAEGGEPPLDDLSQLKVNVGRTDKLSEGQFAVNGMEAFYTVRRGELSGQGYSTDDGVFSVVMVRCPDGDKRSRLGVWGGPPSEDGSSLEGTTGDAAEIEAFLSHFDLCG